MVLAIGVAVLAITESQRGHLLKRGTAVPEFEWQGHGSNGVRSRELRGKRVLINFWATWCPPCVREMPMLVKVAASYSSRGLVFVAANADEEGAKAVDRFLQRKLPALGPYVAYPDDKMVRFFHVTSYPTTYLLDGEGRVQAAFEGEMDESHLRNLLDASFSSH